MSSKPRNAGKTIAVCGVAFELPAAYRVTRPSRSKNEGGEDECQFSIQMAKPRDKDLYECHEEGYASQPPYDVCDWYLASGPLPVGTVASVVVANGRLDAGKQITVGDFSFDGSAWHLPTRLGEAPDALKAVTFFGKQAREGLWEYKGQFRRARTENYETEYGGADGELGGLVQLAPNLLVGILGDAHRSRNWAATLSESLRVAAPEDLKRH
ncbi:hypothetical protein RT97_02200 [Variovorax paradoxus]|uniref:Uncharacterized protein n=1 Tax=Variovorax paradoxus TaxID=34073 RepID=A0A0D0LDJ5_VARPD|nr:hypothetical protein [Variovorax paradoxus]KIQ36247.1 hypothetical protein RT97_02200 [Variovorax paradoxus]